MTQKYGYHKQFKSYIIMLLMELWRWWIDTIRLFNEIVQPYLMALKPRKVQLHQTQAIAQQCMIITLLAKVRKHLDQSPI